PLPPEPGALQVPDLGRPGRRIAAQPVRQDPQARAPGALLDRPGAVHQLTEVDPIDAARAVELLREATGDPYVLVRRLSGGETGAHEVVCAPREERFVLKWEVRPESQVLRREAVGLADLLRTRAGWPVPRQRTVDAGGCLVVLQEFMA